MAMNPLSPQSRLHLPKEFARRWKLNVAEEVLAWLAENVTGSVRQLEGAAARLETLTRLQPGPLDVAPLAEPFADDAGRPTVERIVERVGSYFQVEPRKLQAHGRSPARLLPRQITRYLARR